MSMLASSKWKSTLLLLSGTLVELESSGAAVAPSTPSSRVGSYSVVTSRSTVLSSAKVVPGGEVLSYCRRYSWWSLASLCR